MYYIFISSIVDNLKLFITMRFYSILLSCLLFFAACTPDVPESPDKPLHGTPETPENPETPVNPDPIDYGDGSKERPFIIDNANRLEHLML